MHRHHFRGIAQRGADVGVWTHFRLGALSQLHWPGNPAADVGFGSFATEPAGVGYHLDVRFSPKDGVNRPAQLVDS